MTEEIYSSAVEVIEYTGVTPADLKKDTDEELTTLLETWLVQIKDFIDRNRNRNFSTETAGVPAGINNIAMRACANMVMLMIERASSPIVRIDDFSIGMVSENIFTSSIKADLKQYPFKMRVGFIVVGATAEEGDVEEV